MAVMAEVGFHLHPTPLSTRHTHLIVHTQNPLCNIHCRPTSISKNQFIFLLSPWPLHIRRWDSNAELYNTDNFNFDADDKIEDSDDSVEEWVDAFEDFIDSIWIFKVFGSFGWMLPPILLSLLLANGPKAFLLALSLPIGQSTFAFAIQRYQNRDKIKPKRRNKTKKGRSSRFYSSRNIGLRESPEFNRSRRARKKNNGYQSWVSKDNVTADSSDGSAASFNGWDELDLGMDSNVETSRRAGRKTSGFRGRPARKSKMGRLSDSDGPLLLRLLISFFPFLSSWTKFL